MPSAADIFQGVSGSSQGPFSQYLNPAQPVQPRPIDQPMPPATGYESGPVAAGRIALNFLQGIRQNRVADTLEKERNNQLSFNNYHQHASMLAEDPDLAPGGREAILGQANQVLTQHMHREVKDAPEHGPLGILKGVFTQMVGGKIPKTEPIDFDAEQGKLSNLARGYSQRDNFKQLVNEGQQAIEALKRGDPANGIAPNPNPPQEEIVRALTPTYAKVLQTAPNYAQTFLPVLSGGYYPAGSFEGQSQMLTRTLPAAPQTQPPPGAAPGGVQGVVQQNLGMVLPGAPIAGAPAPVRPADNGRQYEVPLGSQERYAQLTGMAGLRNSRIAVSPRQRYITQSGGAFTGHEISGSPVTADNGIWNAETGQKVSEPALPMTSATMGTVVSADGTVYHRDPFTSKLVEEPIKKAVTEETWWNPTARTWVHIPRGGDVPPGLIPQSERIAEIRESGANARTRANNVAKFELQRRAVGARREDLQQANARFYERQIAAAKAGNVREVNTAMERAGAPLPANVLTAAGQNTQALISYLEQERDAAIAAVEEEPEVTPTEAPPAAPPPPKPKAAGAAKTQSSPPPSGGRPPIPKKGAVGALVQ